MAQAAGKQEDLLDGILLAPEVVERWSDVCHSPDTLMLARGVKKVPNEQAKVNPDGTLTIFVKLSGTEIAMVVEKEEWCWA